VNGAGALFGDVHHEAFFFIGELSRLTQVNSKASNHPVVQCQGNIQHHPDAFIPGFFSILNAWIMPDVLDYHHLVGSLQVGQDFLGRYRPLLEVPFTHSIGCCDLELFGLRVEDTQQSPFGVQKFGGLPHRSLLNLPQAPAGVHQFADIPEGVVKGFIVGFITH
jgi:hypothetical protein